MSEHAATREPHAAVAAPVDGAGRRRLRACYECDLVVALPALRPGERADCPRCGHTLVRRHRLPIQYGLALATAALLCLGIAVAFPFVGFEIRGIGNLIDLTDTAGSLIGFGEPLVAASVLLTVVVLPAVYLSGIVWLHLGLLGFAPRAHSHVIARAIVHVTPWMMADVFIVGALVSLVKIAGMADVSLGPAFWFYCAFAILLLKASQSIDPDWLWFALSGEPRAPAGARIGEAAAPQGLAGCAVCGLLNRLDDSPGCRRCHEPLRARHPHSLQRTMALLITAAILYVPANAYPIMTTTTFDSAAPSTIIGGVLLFVEHGDLPIALIIFTASVLVPLGKMLALAWLCFTIERGGPGDRAARVRLYRLVELIGRWSMVDVFVIAILVALIRAGELMSITPGPAALAFTGVVVLSMVAAMSFDPRLIWDAGQGGADGR